METNAVAQLIQPTTAERWQERVKKKKKKRLFNKVMRLMPKCLTAYKYAKNLQPFKMKNKQTNY